MDISISPTRPAAADTLVFVVKKDGLSGLPLSAARTVEAGAKAARFQGESGAVFETFEIGRAHV